ncbi:MAG: 3D-(3,5/4)-trihydroxycyclohexane-1,2-dione acylhydrolase (decyclizing) [Alphaproteobacteria bacterium]|nr:3D-(3,5/4)-trihydroxycyclohexane-1,2-dione acylhydrolase (decyclizing) [Alphaproteobacteria bacterium]
MHQTVTCTTAQAIVRFLCAQKIVLPSGEIAPYFAGAFGIFGHGNVTCLGEALYAHRDQLPMWRGLNEQSMALAAVGYAKARMRQQAMVATSSIGPGATNMVTACGVAHSNRLPLLVLAGDTFANRKPDPVLQQVEHFDTPTTTVNDAFRSVTRYWDRITHPGQLVQSLPQAIAVMLDPATCGPVFFGLSQDTQELAYDFPASMFEDRVWQIPRPRPDKTSLAAAAAVISAAKKPLIVVGGGARYSGAHQLIAEWAAKAGAPVCETVAGRSTLRGDNPLNIGPMGVIGSSSANALAAEADAIIAIGTRLQDFTTGSRTAFNPDATLVSINAARWDGHKHRAIPVIGDAKAVLEELIPATPAFKADAAWQDKAAAERKEWHATLHACGHPNSTSDSNTPAADSSVDSQAPAYAEVIACVNDAALPSDYVISAAGGLPGEMNKAWQALTEDSFDCEFGFSCMGYEIAAAYGAKMARPTDEVFTFCGDGSYMMMNSEIYNSVLTGHKFIAVVCDNGGYGVINRLQNFKGSASYNNLVADAHGVDAPFSVDYAAHAQSMGALARKVASIAELKEAVAWARTTTRTTVIVIDVDAYQWVPGDAWWDVGVPEVSDRPEVTSARAAHVQGRTRQA